MEYSNLNHLMEGSSSCRTSSPFDEAAASPLLGKDSPKVKRWSLFGSKSSSLSSAAAAKDQESRLSTAYRNHDYCNNSNATTITTHSIEFEMSESSSSHIEEEMGNIFQLRFDNNNNNYADLDFAIMRERQDEISGINSSILQLHEIQKGAFLYISP